MKYPTLMELIFYWEKIHKYIKYVIYKIVINSIKKRKAGKGWRIYGVEAIFNKLIEVLFEKVTFGPCV